MTEAERDPHTGHMTTGHEWNGIKELNTPVPRPVYFFLTAAAIFAVVYWVLMPAWPLGRAYTKGLLKIDQREIVKDSLKQAALTRSVWTTPIETESLATIRADPRLMRIVRETGHALFGDNCAACHGRDAKGNNGFPNLTTTSWLWGGSPQAIAETIRVGINSDNPQTRTSQMPAFGRDGILPRPAIEKVVDYVKSLSDPSMGKRDATSIMAGKTIFAANCAVCHGDRGTGNPEMGVPNLTDKFWIYGGDPETIFTTVWGGRQGHMPTWEKRLPLVDRKILALYVFSLRDPNQ